MIKRNTIIHPKCFNIITGRTQLNSLHQSIQQSIRLIITTRRGELLGDPDYGSNLYKFIYETNCNIQWTLIEDDLKDSIAKYETRIRVEEIIFSNPNSSTLNIKIVYSLVQMEELGDITFSVLLPSNGGNINGKNG